jgi:hypothetical protein
MLPGAEATTDDPFLRRRSFRSANTVKPIHPKAPAKTSITAGIVSMIQFGCGQDKCPARVIGIGTGTSTMNSRSVIEVSTVQPRMYQQSQKP